MKKFLYLILSCSLLILACGASDNEPESGEVPEIPSMVDSNILVAYFSRTGNTAEIAGFISGFTGGQLFRISTVQFYPEDYTEATVIAQQEKDADARPALSTHVANMAGYDVIFIGYPIWWGTFPMAVATFIEEYDFTGKTVIPFCTHQGSGSGTSFRDMEVLLPGIDILQGYHVAGTGASGAMNAIAQWLRSIDETLLINQ